MKEVYCEKIFLVEEEESGKTASRALSLSLSCLFFIRERIEREMGDGGDERRSFWRE